MLLKKLTIAVALSVATVLSVAEPLVLQPKVATPVAEVTKKCAEGCVVFDALDLKVLEDTVNKMLIDAYKAGLKDKKNNI